MSNMLAIAKQEVKRLRSRFRGESSRVVMVVQALALVVAYLAFRQGPVLTRGIYRVGISPDGPPVADQRFHITVCDARTGREMLEGGTIDAYIDGPLVMTRGDQRSRYAAGALSRTLQRQELGRIASEYELDRAFPLRVQVRYLPGPDAPPDLARPSLGAWLSALPDAAGAPESGASTSPSPESTTAPTRPSDQAVAAQIERMDQGDPRQQIDMAYAADEDILIPSLMDPPIPFAQVILAFLYVMPVSFISVFFTGSFMRERTDRRITVLLSTPTTPFQIIMGKIGPYFLYAVLSVIMITLALRGNVLLALAIFVPVILFIFAIYLMVPLLYRTFRDTTFISMLAVAGITSYLVFPAMFSGINDFAYMSPLTLAVDMYRGEAFGPRTYLFATLPMMLLFGISLYMATRILNEEYLMAFRPLYQKVAEALYLAMNRARLRLSVLVLGLATIPLVFMGQLVALALSTNLPRGAMMAMLMFAAALIEETAKSVGVVTLMSKGHADSTQEVLLLSALSALGFLIGEKLVLLISVAVVSETMLSQAIYGLGQIWVPLVAHLVCTAVTCLLTRRFGTRRYAWAVMAGAALHTIYNLTIIRYLA